MENGNRGIMILIIEICNQKFHYFEFVKPIQDILKKNNFEFITIDYKNLNQDIISQVDKIIISGTSLKDNIFLKDIDYFNWIKKFYKPILGICGGMHLLGLIFNGKLKKQQEIGLTLVSFKNKFLGISGKQEVYELHNFLVESKYFEIFAESEKCVQAIKHFKQPYFGVLFHPEVRNKEIIVNFVKN